MPTFQRKLLIMLGLALAIVALTTAAVMYNARQEAQTEQLVYESGSRITILDNLLASLFEAESSQRAFAASRDALFINEHRQERDNVERLLAAFRQQDFAVEPTLTTQLIDLIEQRTALMDELLLVSQEQGTVAAAQMIASYEGKRSMDRIRDVSSRMVQAERSRMERKQLEFERLSQRLQLWIVLAGLINSLLLVGAFLLIRREAQRSENLVEQLRQTSNEVTLVNQLSSGLQSCETREDTAAVLQHYMLRLFPGMTGGLYLMRGCRNLLQLAAAWGEEADHLVDPIEPQQCWALRMGHSHQTSDPDKALRCQHWPDLHHAYLCLPLLAQGEIVGMLHLSLRDKGKLEEAQRLAELLSTHAAAAMAGILLREALHHQSVRDPLTGLFNRRYLEETMEREQLRAKRNKSGFGLIMLDVDHFKRFNDDYGHQAGDLLLKELSQYLRRYIRGEDIACRYGGEEFLLVLPGATLEQCRERAEEIRRNLAGLQLDFQDQRLPSVTASIGVAAYPDHGEEWQGIQHLADKALYQAKRSGRNQVNVAPLPRTPDEE